MSVMYSFLIVFTNILSVSGYHLCIWCVQRLLAVSGREYHADTDGLQTFHMKSR